jgi:4-amino-4-deoxy-L-arabinose transferase-like glycosyltransferase
LLINALLWTLIPWLTGHSLPLDATEQIAWGHQWQWGYYKHPFLPAWFAEISWQLLGDAGVYALGQLAILATLLFVFLLGRRLLGTERAALGTLLTLGVYYFIWPTNEWNNNIAQMPFWAAAVYFFHRALDNERAPQRYQNWALTGLALGLGMLSKYSTAVLIAVLFLYLLLHRTHRKQLASVAPWIGGLVLLLVFLPNALWLVQNHFLPLTYALNRAENGTSGVWHNAALALRYFMVQLLDHVPLLLILAFAGLLAGRFWSIRAAPSESQRFLWFIGLGPTLLIVLGAIGTQSELRDMWGAPMWNLSGLIVAAYLLPLSAQHSARLLRVMTGFVAVVALACALNATVLPAFSHKPARTQWPDQAMADYVRTVWQQHAQQQPLPILAGDHWLTEMIALRLSPRPATFTDANLARSPWIAPLLAQHKTVFCIWEGLLTDEPAALSQLGTPIASGSKAFAWPKSSLAPLQISWAIVYPRLNQSSGATVQVAP